MPQTYDRLARFYDAAFSPLERFYLDNLRKRVLAELPNDGRVLEIGAGTGVNFKYYPSCRHAVASEISLKMIDIARGKSDKIDILQADAQTLPFPANHFDAAFATLVFCSVPDPAKGFAEILRVLKPGGKLILIEHVRPEGLLGYVFDALNILTTALIDDHFNRRTAEAVAAAGLGITAVEKRLAGILNVIMATKTESSQPRV
jgi:ubiquinone/menaquinone biosynthesis C-methylase UbiE